MVNINLLPPENKLKIKQAKQSANIFSICLVAILVFAVSSFIISAIRKDLFLPELDSYKTQINSENTKSDSLSDLEKKALFINDRSQLALQINNQKPYWSQIIQELINSVPENVQVVSLSADITKAPNFVLQGNTTSEREAIKFKEKLEASKFFKDVAFKSSTNVPGQTDAEQKLNFSLEFNLESKSLSNSQDKAVK
jgi:Tfp pilus assembly protein PilN